MDAKIGNVIEKQRKHPKKHKCLLRMKSSNNDIILLQIVV